MRKILVVVVGCLLSVVVCADGPKYEVFTQLAGLAVSHDVENNLVETILYVTNHDRRPILCDASMNTNRQEKSKGEETPVAPEQTVAFSFKHGKSITNVRLYLVCEANGAAIETPVPKESTNPSAEKNNPTRKAIPIVEEDLGHY